MSDGNRLDQLKTLVTSIVRGLVDNEGAVKVATTENRYPMYLEVTVDPADFKRVLGQQGAVADALRVLVNSFSGKLKLTPCFLTLVDPRYKGENNEYKDSQRKAPATT